MCIIAVKPKNVRCPDKEILKNMFISNPDGAGVAFNLKNKLYIIKGLMTFEDFWNVCKNIPDESGAIYHTRIETSGGVCKELTHPFLLCEDIDEQRKLNISIKKGYAVAHNGVFNEFGKKELNNDTTQFISKYLYPLKKLNDKTSGSVLDNSLDAIINKLCGTSNKLAIINQDGQVKRYGGSWIQDKGIYYSNHTYQNFPTYHSFFNDFNSNNYNWNKKLKPKKTTAEEIEDLLKNDCDFIKFYSEWFDNLSEEEILRYYKNDFI